ncbi:hypothetical protein OPV22_031215 [Ensete ventricosum]|uniref:Uncharacterized protein n=1 Tax=Ensete ventricosum TaxID=4639 RepID=A0AAV8PIS9_ENSVE|nr:hypothetical protein OPV22_031215 [Ensete ventricosum]
MKPIMSVMFLLFLVLLAANRTTGIRLLEEESVASLRNQVHEEKISMKEGSGVRGALLRGCHGDCSGKSRKLMTDAMATSKNDIGSQDDLRKAPPVSRQPQTHPDVVDIAGMDYSPANKKPPIHN